MCERVVCVRVVCVRAVCERDGGRRQERHVGVSAQPKTSAPHKHVGNKGNNVPACALPGPVPLCLKWTPLDSYKLPLIKRNTATGKSNGLLLSSPKCLYETHGKSKEK